MSIGPSSASWNGPQLKIERAQVNATHAASFAYSQYGGPPTSGRPYVSMRPIPSAHDQYAPQSETEIEDSVQDTLEFDQLDSSEPSAEAPIDYFKDDYGCETYSYPPLE